MVPQTKRTKRRRFSIVLSVTKKKLRCQNRIRAKKADNVPKKTSLQQCRKEHLRKSARKIPVKERREKASAKGCTEEAPAKNARTEKAPQWSASKKPRQKSTRKEPQQNCARKKTTQKSTWNSWCRAVKNDSAYVLTPGGHNRENIREKISSIKSQLYTAPIESLPL